MIPTDPVFGTLSKTLDAAAARQRILASNVANVDTPGYRSQDLDFEAALSEAMQSENLALHRSDAQHLPGRNGGGLQVIEVEGVARRDDNSVDLDREMSKLAETSMLYQAGTGILQSKMRILRNVITGGR